MIVTTKYANHNRARLHGNNAYKQKGLALPLTLVLLLVMTLIGVATLRSTTMEENMTANSRLRQVAFNAAESALREAEIVSERLNGDEIRAKFFGLDIVTGLPKPRPDDSIPNQGDNCEGGDGGFCTPAQFTSGASPTPNGERWEDPVLNVWNNPERHIEYSGFADPQLNFEENGVIEAPKYIIEFLGNYDYREPNVRLTSQPNVRPKFEGAYRGNCRDAELNTLTPPNDEWPYCASDPRVFRVTVRATAGPPARQAVVFLQSTLRVP